MAVVTGNLIAEFVGKLADGGTSPGHNDGTPTSTWDNIVTAGEDGALSNFAYSTSSGWAGDGSVGDPYRLCFDVDANVLTTVSETESGAHSWEFWLRATTVDTGLQDAQRVLFSHAAEWEWQPIFATQYMTGRPIYYAGSDNYRYFNAPTIDIEDGNFHHWVVTIPGSAHADIESCLLYIDGVGQGAGSTYDGSDFRAWGSAFRIGRGDSNQSSVLAGIATIRVYSDVLSPEEVTQNLNAGVLAASTDAAAPTLTGIRIERHIG